MMYLVSYNRSLLTNHNKWIWLHDLPGFLWFPMAYLCLQIMRNRFAYMVSYCFQLLIGAYKSRQVNLAAQFTWFLIVSCGLLVPANHGKPICLNDLLVIGATMSQGVHFGCTIYLVSYGFLWRTCAYKTKENDFSKRFPWFLILYGVFRTKVPGFLHLELF